MLLSLVFSLTGIGVLHLPDRLPLPGVVAGLTALALFTAALVVALTDQGGF